MFNIIYKGVYGKISGDLFITLCSAIVVDLRHLARINEYYRTQGNK